MYVQVFAWNLKMSLFVCVHVCVKTAALCPLKAATHSLQCPLKSDSLLHTYMHAAFSVSLVTTFSQSACYCRFIICF